jgi:flavin reductase (DIM6/NTAB) family NADH-FMN oxidoreductase RutF
MRKISPENWEKNVFSAIGKEWLLLTAEKDGKVNTMTASWGGMGILWGKQVAFLFIRPQRYTKEFVDASDTLSISILPEEFRKELNYFGTVSGRDEDKIQKAGLPLSREEGVPYFADAHTAMICRKLYAQELEEGCFLDPSLTEKWYPTKDYHTMYVVELETVLVK